MFHPTGAPAPYGMSSFFRPFALPGGGTSPSPSEFVRYKFEGPALALECVALLKEDPTHFVERVDTAFDLRS